MHIFIPVMFALIAILFLIHTTFTWNKTIWTMSFTKEAVVEKANRKQFLIIKNTQGLSFATLFALLSFFVWQNHNGALNVIIPFVISPSVLLSLHIQRKLIALTVNR